MNPNGARNASSPLFRRIRFEDFETCWAGPHPLRAGFCFGSEDGRLWFTDEEGTDISGGPTKGSLSGEAVNGLAAWQRWLMVTTRKDVNFITISLSAGQPPHSLVAPVGAHGVTVTRNGYFVCPLGPTGMLVWKADEEGPGPFRIGGEAEADPNFYRIVTMRSHGGVEVLACATRRGGVAAMEFAGSSQTHALSTITFEGLDVVDVCPLSPGTESLALAAASRDGNLILFRDVFQDKKPIMMKFDAVAGKVYRLLSCRGHFFLLTSKGLYVLANLVGRFVAGQSLDDVTTPILALQMEAVDANLYRDQRLLIVLVDEVRSYDIGVIHDGTPESIAHGEVRDFPPDVKQPGLGGKSAPLAEFRESRPRSVFPNWKRGGAEQRSTPITVGA